MGVGRVLGARQSLLGCLATSSGCAGGSRDMLRRPVAAEQVGEERSRKQQVGEARLHAESERGKRSGEERSREQGPEQRPQYAHQMSDVERLAVIDLGSNSF